jgi:hypothetical protein
MYAGFNDKLYVGVENADEQGFFNGFRVRLASAGCDYCRRVSALPTFWITLSM